MRNGIALLLIIIFHFGHSQVIKGKVINKKTGSGIPLAEVFCLETQNGTIADSNGNWQLENVVNFQMTLHITADDFDSKLITIVDPKEELTTKLEHAHIHLDEVIVSTTSSKLQRNTTSPVESRKIADLNKIEQTTLIDALSNMPGIYNFSTGNGISKPVIRGLSGMRVLTSQNGLRIENQQWGADHGFAIFNLGVDQVEVIKGPSSLIYGADALGGVIYIADEPYANVGESELSASTKFESNSMAIVNKISYKNSKKNLRYVIYGGYFSRGDYGTPDSSGNTLFDLKDNQFVTNSRNSGASIKTAIGYNKNNWITNFRYQLLYFQNGLPGHTHDTVWDASTFLSNNQSRVFKIPAQKIINHLAQWENKFYFRKDELVAQLGFTSNELKEFEGKVTVPGIDMTLQNLSHNLSWKHKLNQNIEIVSGSQGMLQSNSNSPTAREILIENADFFDLGAFSLIRGTFGLWNIQAGARYDQRSINTSEANNPFSETYGGLNYSIGVSRSSNTFTTRLNASSGFRPPHISELLANGVHHATNQYLIGDANLVAERANQIDLYLGVHREHLEIIVNPFVNQINNYTYLNPTSDDDPISGLPIFDIKQTNALLLGGDIALHYHPHTAHWLHLESNFSLLSTQDNFGNPLPRIPQNRINNIVKIKFENHKKFKIKSLSAQYVHMFNQDEIVAYETETDAYQLINIGCSGSWNTKQKIDFSLGVNNLLNTHYIDHLSRLKTYGLANPGRNFYIKINFLISKS